MRKAAKFMKNHCKVKIHFVMTFSYISNIDTIKTWAISNDYLIFKPQIGDENFDSYHLVNLGNGNSTLLIKDCINDPTCTNSAAKIYLIYSNL
jgi:hypothetical protein